MTALQDEIRRFRSRTRGSAGMHESAKKYTPFGVHSNYRAVDPYPLYIRRARGVSLTDVDDNTYLDFSMGFGAMVTGHAHPRLVEALRERAGNGTLFGFEGEETARLCGLLCDRFRTERVKLSNTGLDATMFALRFARHASRRSGVLKFEGCYHGSHDAVLASVKPPRDLAGDPHRPAVVAASTGLLPDAHASVFVAPFNDLPSTEEIAEAHADDLAAIIVEPIPMNMGFVLPRKGFLEGLRNLSDRLGAMLIFDEVKTCGKFYGGAEEAFGARPDVKVLGKSLAGGLPLAAVAARADILDAVQPGVVSHAGTFNGNPLSVTAAQVTLEEILTRAAMNAAAALGEDLGRGYRDILEDRKVEGFVQYRGISGSPVFAPKDVVGWRSFLDVDVGKWWGYYHAMLNRGVVPMATGPDEQWTVSVQHTKEHVSAHLDAFKEVAALLPQFGARKPIVEAI